jgi:hypothetical protein
VIIFLYAWFIQLKLAKIKKYGLHKVIKYRMTKTFSEENFQRDLLTSGKDITETITNPNNSLNFFCFVLNEVLAKHAPMKEKRAKREHQHDWFTDEIIKTINLRNKCHNKGDVDQYKILRNKVTPLIRMAKNNFSDNAIEENRDSKYVKKLLTSIKLNG